MIACSSVAGGLAPAAATAAVAASPGQAIGAFSGGSVTFPFSTLGLERSMDLGIPDGTGSVTVPVPDGLSPTAVAGTFDIPVDLGGGYVEFQGSNGTFLGAVPLPSTPGSQVTVPFLVDLRSAPVINGGAVVQLTLRQFHGTGHCGQPQQLVATDFRVTFSGRPQVPDSVATFFPGVLRSVQLWVPPSVAPAEQSAVLDLGAAVVHRYGLQPVDVSVHPLPAGRDLPPPSSEPFERQVVIRQSDGAPGSVELRSVPSANPVLVLSGGAMSLPLQVALFSRQLDRVVQVDGVQVQQASTPQVVASNEQTFSQLGMTGTLQVSGQRQLSVSVDDSRLGGLPSGGLDVDAVAEYTPVPPQDRGSVSVSSSGVVLTTSPLNDSGRFEQEFSVPAPLVQRATPLLFTVTYWPSNGSCSWLTPFITFTLDPRSTVGADLEQPPTSGGFPAVPGALLPSFDVGIEGSGEAALSVAMATVCGFQRLSAVVLRPVVLPLHQVLSSTTPSLLVAQAPTVRSAGLDPPLGIEGNEATYRVAGGAPVTMHFAGGLGALEVFDDSARDRTVALATTTAGWSAIDPVFAKLDASTSDWSSVTGDVLVAGHQGRVVDLTVRAGGGQVFVPSSGGVWRVYLAVGIAALVTAALVILAVVLVRRRRRPSPGS